MRLRLRFWRREPPWLGDRAPEPKPPIVTRFTDGGVLSFEGRVDPLEIVVGALNASGADGVGRVISFRERGRDGEG
jgi:hypothetical protein